MGEGGRVITKSVLLTLIRAWVVYEHGAHNLLAHISLRHYAHNIALRWVYVAEHAHNYVHLIRFKLV